MRSLPCLVAVAVLIALPSRSSATTPPPPDLGDDWDHAVRAAAPDLERCHQLGVAAGVFGDVHVRVDARTGKWRTSASRSLGTLGRKLTGCVRRAIARRFAFYRTRDEGLLEDRLEHTAHIGKPRPLLPPAGQLLPIWREVRGTGRAAARARARLRGLLPPDYRLGKRDCLQTDRASVHQVEYLWMGAVGSWVPPLWEPVISKVLGYRSHVAVWDPAGALVVKGAGGLCLEPFDAARRTALQSGFDAAGTCWAGGFTDTLLRPRFEFPAHHRYTSVDTYNGRACAVTTTGQVLCCGSAVPALPPAPRPVVSIALGHEFACGLDRVGAVSCWGSLAPPPSGSFRRIRAAYRHACGLRTTGEIACWGSGHLSSSASHGGQFVDVAATGSNACGVGRSGRVTCWALADREEEPPGLFSAIAMDQTGRCGLRRDGTIGCWGSSGAPVHTPLPGRFRDLAVGMPFYVCGRRDDNTVACLDQPSPWPIRKPRPPANARFVQIDGDQVQFCGVAEGGRVHCWGDPWPATLGDAPDYAALMVPAARPFERAITLSGRVIDEWGKPIAGAEVLLCSDANPCGTVAYQAMLSGARFGEIVAGLERSWEPDSFALVATGRDGQWAASFAFNPRHATDDQIRAVVTAPGRELVERETRLFDTSLLLADYRLRPAASVDLEPWCGNYRCKGEFSTRALPTTRFTGTHVERLPPATYTIEVWGKWDEPYQRHGTAVVDVTYASRALRVRVPMHPTGTGMSIRGAAEVLQAGTSILDKLPISADCGGTRGKRVFRKTETDALGKFEIRDAGSPPCTVSLHLPSRGTLRSVKVETLPATGVLLEATIPGP